MIGDAAGRRTIRVPVPVAVVAVVAAANELAAAITDRPPLLGWRSWTRSGTASGRCRTGGHARSSATGPRSPRNRAWPKRRRGTGRRDGCDDEAPGDPPQCGQRRRAGRLVPRGHRPVLRAGRHVARRRDARGQRHDPRGRRRRGRTGARAGRGNPGRWPAGQAGQPAACQPSPRRAGRRRCSRWSTTGVRSKAGARCSPRLLAGGCRAVQHHDPADHLAWLERHGIERIVTGSDRVDLASALGGLAARFGVKTVRVDSGGKLNGELLRLGLVDEISLLVHPYLVGGTSPASMFRAANLRHEVGVLPLEPAAVTEGEAASSGCATPSRSSAALTLTGRSWAKDACSPSAATASDGDVPPGESTIGRADRRGRCGPSRR